MTTTTRDELVAALLAPGYGWQATTPEPGSEAIATRVRDGAAERLYLRRAPTGWLIIIATAGTPVAAVRGEAIAFAADDWVAVEGTASVADAALRWLP